MSESTRDILIAHAEGGVFFVRQEVRKEQLVKQVPGLCCARCKASGMTPFVVKTNIRS